MEGEQTEGGGWLNEGRKTAALGVRELMGADGGGARGGGPGGVGVRNGVTASGGGWGAAALMRRGGRGWKGRAWGERGWGAEGWRAAGPSAEVG
jgi:hypothetical protein